MAGLQYNFFPTDFFYPRQAQSKPVETSSAALTLQTQSQNRDVDDIDSRPQQPQQPGNMVLQGNKTSVSMRRQGDKLAGRNIFKQNRDKQVKLPQNSLSWLISIPEELSD